MTPLDTKSAVREAIGGANHLIEQVERSLQRLASLRPLDPVRLATLDDSGWDAIYAFQMKFLLLQDLASKRLVRGVIALSGEDPRDLSAKAALLRLETLGALSSMDRWLDVATVRNTLAHDYPVNLTLFVERFEDAWAHAPQLLASVRELLAYIDKEALLDG